MSEASGFTERGEQDCESSCHGWRGQKLTRWLGLAAWALLTPGSAGAVVSDAGLTPKHYIPALRTAQTILVEATAYTDQGELDPGPMIEVLTRRLEEIGYSVVANLAEPHDVGVQIACEAATPHEATRVLPGEPDLLTSSGPSPGPPCLLSYLYQGKPMDWQRVDRIIFTAGLQAAKAVAGAEPAPGPMATFTHYLEQFEFPLLLSAEWGQVDRLRALLDAPDTGRRRKLQIISLLGEIRSEDAFQCLEDALRDPFLVEAAARALGNFGGRAKAPLMRLLRTASRPELQAAAAHALGSVGATTGDTSATPLLLDLLARPGLPTAVQIEIVWALGKSPDFRAHPALEQLEREVWSIRSDDPELQELRAAIQWALRQVRQGGHTDAY